MAASTGKATTNTRTTKPARTAAAANTKSDESVIRQLIADWARALEARDLDALTAGYTDDALLFDAIPPYKVQGAAAIRKVWEFCLPCFPKQFKSEHRDVNITVSGDVAFATALHHIKPIGGDHPAGQSWMRVTVGYQRINGEWKVKHEHVSIPFNPMDDTAWHITNPEKLEAPDWSKAACTQAVSVARS